MAVTYSEVRDEEVVAPGRVRGGRLDRHLGSLSAKERVARGKAARKVVPREAHASFERQAGRTEPLELLERQALTRLSELVPIRYGRMLVSPFAYFRGAALPMADDLSLTPTTGLVVQACGDAHLSNFGIFASPERKLLFSLNDFDETLPGPWEWDVKRLTASLEVAARDNGLSKKQRRRVVISAARVYREAMADFATMTNLEVWYARADDAMVRSMFKSRLDAEGAKAIDKGLAKAQTRDSMQAFSKLCGIIDGKLRIIADPPLVMPLSHLIGEEPVVATYFDRLPPEIDKYVATLTPERRVLFSRYSLADMARKVVGVGSVGTRCWILLFTDHDGDEPLFLQLKEALPSVLESYTGRGDYTNEGHRVVDGQRMMQSASDIFLGHLRTDQVGDNQNHDFYVRQLRDWKYSLDVEQMGTDALEVYGELCAWTLARAHARSGDSLAIAAYLGKSAVFDEAIGEFASAYADQNERDYDALALAAAKGRVVAFSNL
jgi:uncharacterized protein (DUF2252 family)